MITQAVFNFNIERTEKNITANAGLSFLARYIHGLGINQLADKYLPLPGNAKGYKPSEYVDTFILLLCGGGRSLEDNRMLKQDRPLQKILGSRAVPSSDAMGDWLRRVGKEGLPGAGLIQAKVIERLMRHSDTTVYTLDVDATEIVSHKQSARFTYNKNKGYMPMLGFLAENQLCICDEFRAGNESPNSKQIPFYENCVRNMPTGKRIGYYRADSACYQSALINRLEKDTVRFAITARMDKAVYQAIAQIPETDWYCPKDDPDHLFEYALTVHSMEETDQAFYLSVKRERIRQDELFEHMSEYKYHAVATNHDPDKLKAHCIHRWYNQRCRAENLNKEVKSGFGLERMPCGTFKANALFFRIGILSYNLFVGFKRLCCPRGWMQHTIATVRWRLLHVAGQVVYHARKLTLRLRVSDEMMRVYEYIVERIAVLSACYAH